MITTYFVLKYLHLIGATVLLGTGAGIAFFMLLAHRSSDTATIAGVARIVVVADFVFTATAVVAQPVTGVLLVREAGSITAPRRLHGLALRLRSRERTTREKFSMTAVRLPPKTSKYSFATEGSPLAR